METESTQMYLITIYRLTRQNAQASTKDIAQMLGVSLPSVSERIKRLAKQGYLLHEWRQGSHLTEAGERIAVNILRKHRLLETFMVRKVGYDIDEIHEEACLMEHAISDRFADQLEIMLDFPDVDPHGHPIPSKQGQVADLNYPTLADTPPGKSVVVRQVSDWDAKQLHYLRDLGIVPGTALQILEAAPFEGPLTLQIDGKTTALARDIAATIGVTSSCPSD